MGHKPNVLIVGGGIGGMSAAIALRQRDIPVKLVEIDAQWRAIGAGLTLNGATLRAMEALGIADEVRERGHVHGGRRLHDHDGSIIADFPAYSPERGDLTASGGILRPVLHGILSQHTLDAGADVLLGFTVTGLIQTADGIDVTFSNGSAERFDVVVGADGIASQVRSLIMPDAPKPSFTGQGAWRAVFPRPPEIKATYLYVDAGYKLGLNPVSREEMYLFLLESVPDNPWREPEDWPTLLAERLRRFGGLPRELADTLSDRSSINYRPLEAMILPPPWHVGGVVLLGDAVHPTTPHAGYGAGLAMEDGIVLAECLGEYEMADAFVRYTERRYGRCRDIVEQSLALGRLEMELAPAQAQVAASTALFLRTHEPY